MSRHVKRAATAFQVGSHVVTLNNQNTMLLELEKTVEKDGQLHSFSFVMHDNRIYVFEKLNVPETQKYNVKGSTSQSFSSSRGLEMAWNPFVANRGEERKENEDDRIPNITYNNNNNDIAANDEREPEEVVAIDTSVSTPAKDVIQNILTSTRFRVLAFMYLFFRLFDDTAFVGIIVASIYNAKLATLTPNDLALFSMIGLEVFYDVLSSVNKYWILSRVNFYIGIVLYCFYFGLVCHLEMDPRKFDMIMLILSFRLLCFLIGIGIDIYIDINVHDVLFSAQTCRDENSDVEQKQSDQKHHSLFSYVQEAMVSKYFALEFGKLTRPLFYGLLTHWFYWKCQEKCGPVNSHIPQKDVKKCDHLVIFGFTSWRNIVDPYYSRVKHIQETHHDETSFKEETLQQMLINIKCMIPTNYKYCGSFFAWSFYSVHSWGDSDPKIWNEVDFNQTTGHWKYLLIVIPMIITFFLFLCVMLLALLAVVVMFLLMTIPLTVATIFNKCGCKDRSYSVSFCRCKQCMNFCREIKEI
jgi:hypothetical protein